MSHTHSHTHDDDHHEEVAQLWIALKSLASPNSIQDAGSRITLIGLLANIALTVVKAVAGLALNSAALLADAGHSLSDLVGDIVVLFCWNFSKKPPSNTYPYGYGKYESLGSFIVSVLLVLGGAGIGLHSFQLLSNTLRPDTFHTNNHHDHDALDPNAAWFALGSVLIKEYLYRITMAVAKQENSNVLAANALHHRSDAYSGVIALVAIGTTWLGFTMADPIGGLVVGAMIIHQGAGLLIDSVKELLDASTTPDYASRLTLFLDASQPRLGKVHAVKTYKSGSYTRVEIVASTTGQLTLQQFHELEADIEKQVKEWSEFGCSEVVLRYKP